MFCQQNTLQLIELNFEQTQTIHSLFASNDPIKIIQSLEILGNVKIDMERAVLFLDEIQANPAAILSLRYFFEKVPQLAVIAAESLLEFAFNSSIASSLFCLFPQLLLPSLFLTTFPHLFNPLLDRQLP